MTFIVSFFDPCTSKESPDSIARKTSKNSCSLLCPLSMSVIGNPEVMTTPFTVLLLLNLAILFTGNLLQYFLQQRDDGVLVI